MHNLDTLYTHIHSYTLHTPQIHPLKTPIDPLHISYTPAIHPLYTPYMLHSLLKFHEHSYVYLIIPKGFLCIGVAGLVIFYDRTDSNADSYIESKKLMIGDVHFIAGAVCASDEKVR